MFENEKESKGFVTANPPSPEWLWRDKPCDGLVTDCDGKCDGLGLRKCLSDKVCDGVTAGKGDGWGIGKAKG
jgi:hypothetical protein